MTTQTRRTVQPTGWAIVAGTLILVLAGFNLIFGITALLNSHVLVVQNGSLAVWDLKTYGWISVIIGGFLAVVAFGLFWTVRWARWAGIVIAGLNALAQMGTITINPWWTIAVIALDVLVIYHLAQGATRPA
jgi:hypothetical protein